MYFARAIAILSLCTLLCGCFGASEGGFPGRGVSSVDEADTASAEEFSLFVERDGSGNPLRAVIDGGAMGRIDLPYAGNDPGNGYYHVFQRSGDPREQIYVPDPEDFNLDHSTYGVWLRRNPDGSFDSAGAGFGSITDSAEIPVVGARFYGQGVGAYSTGSGSNIVTMDIDIATDFSTIDIDSSNTIDIDTGDSFSSIDFFGSGSVLGNTYSGTIETYGGMSGVFSGQFNGPTATETSGGFGFSDAAANVQFNGGFGATRN